MELMSHFDDCKEWAIMERVWFKSNHSNKFNLKYLNQTTPIKTRGKLMKSLDGLVNKGWIKKIPIGSSGKHHKYALNKESFVQWIESELAVKSGNLTKNGREIRPNLVRKSDCIDNRDNSLENVPDIRKNPDIEKLIGRLKDKQAAVTLEKKEDFQAITKSLFEKIKAEMIQAAAANGVNYVPSDEVINQKAATHWKWRRN